MYRKKTPCLYIVIPCYNEESVLPITAPLFRKKILDLISANAISKDSKVLFVNDGSKDQTWEIIRQLADADPVYSGISLSRNRGHQNALLAGLMEAKTKCDISISIDCDGQDDINAMDEMVKAYQEGSEIVYGVRSSRKTDTAFKRMTAQMFYRLLACMGAEVVYNHADYRLVSAKALDAFAQFKEVNLYLRGMFPLVGFPSSCVYYERSERIAGESHYPLRKMLALAFDGITSLSIKPIRIITNLGVLISMGSFAAILWVLICFFCGTVVPGWSSILLCVCLLGGIQLIAIGILGEYIGKIYLESKSRPRFIVGERTDEE